MCSLNLVKMAGPSLENRKWCPRHQFQLKNIEKQTRKRKREAMSEKRDSCFASRKRCFMSSSVSAKKRMRSRKRNKNNINGDLSCILNTTWKRNFYNKIVHFSFWTGSLKTWVHANKEKTRSGISTTRTTRTSTFTPKIETSFPCQVCLPFEITVSCKL